tara:strand:- start:117 stop:620 length:504 start_codon:yes stop_codon:yes gene_type:complete
MPFDSTNIQDRASLVSSVSTIVKTFDKAGKEIDQAKDKKSTACDDILITFRIALNEYDIVPFMFWQDICDAHGYAYTRLDVMTGKASKIEGEKPHNTLKNVASRIKKYYEEYGNLDATSYGELRDCLKPDPKSDYDIALDKLVKLSDTELRIIVEDILERLNGTKEA